MVGGSRPRAQGTVRSPIPVHGCLGPAEPALADRRRTRLLSASKVAGRPNKRLKVPQAPKARRRGVHVGETRPLLRKLPVGAEGRSYGMPSFLLNGRFLARFRDNDTVLVLHLATISERDVLMELDPRAFFFTEDCRNYPAVLVRLAEVARPLLIDVVTDAWRHVASLPPPRPRKKPRRSRNA